MLDQTLDTFVQVVKCGSFSAAAKQMYLSPNAIKKRIGTLEMQNGLQLFRRSNQGVELTEAGESLYRDLLLVQQQYKTSVEKARLIQEKSRGVLSIGVMNTFAELFVTSPWFDVRKKMIGYPLQIAYYGTSPSDMNDMLAEVGTTTDMCVDVYDKNWAEKAGLCACKVSDFPLCIAVPDVWEVTDEENSLLQLLEGKCLAAIPEGRAKAFDAARCALKERCPGLQFADIREYTVRTMNDCHMKNYPVLLPANQADRYPFFKICPLKDFSVSFGIYYCRSEEKRLRKFLEKFLPE